MFSGDNNNNNNRPNCRYEHTALRLIFSTRKSQHNRDPVPLPSRHRTAPSYLVIACRQSTAGPADTADGRRRLRPAKTDSLVARRFATRRRVVPVRAWLRWQRSLHVARRTVYRRRTPLQNRCLLPDRSLKLFFCYFIRHPDQIKACSPHTN